MNKITKKKIIDKVFYEKTTKSCIHFEVTYLASSIKPETRGDFFALQITIDCLGAPNNPSFHVFSSENGMRNQSLKRKTERSESHSS